MPLGILPSGIVGAVASPSPVLGILPSGLWGEMPWGSDGALRLLPSGLMGETAPTPTTTWTAWDATRKASTATISGLQVSFGNQGIAAADMHVDAETANRYWEVSIDSISGNVAGVGIVREDFADWTGVAGYSAAGAVSRWSDGSLDYWVGASTAETTGSTTFAAGDVMALCLKNGALYVGKASAGAVTWLDGCDPETETGAPVTGITGRYGPSVSAYSTGTRAMTANFGAAAWVGAAPTGAIGWPHAPTLGAHTMYKGEDYSTATPVVTSSIDTRAGSSYLVSRGAFATVDTVPTDNKSNTFTLDASADYAGYSGTFDARNFVALNGFGGSGHQVTLDNSAASGREVTLAFVEIVKDDGNTVHVEDVSYTYAPTGATDVSAAVNTTGPALLVAIWTGDAGGLSHTADPGPEWHVIDSFLALPPNSAVQYAVAVRDVDAAGSYGVTWAVTPDEGSPLWIYAFQSGAPAPVPMTLVGTLPNALVGVPYNATLTLEGDFTAPVTIDTSAGTRPAWMTASVSGKTVSFGGTPTSAAAAAAFTVRGTDSSSTPQVATSAQSVAVVAASWTTWDAANDTVYGISFSNGDLTATVAGDNKGTRALASVDVAGAHHYYELHVDSATASTTWYAGFATAAWAKDSPPGTGYADPPTAFSVSSAGTMFLSQSNKGSSGLTFATGDTMLMYLAAGGGVYIGRRRSGTTSWATGHDPNTETDTPNYTLPAGTWGPACGADASGSKSVVLTANFGASAWADTPPAGAIGWAG
jgi:hypothetical protein